MSFETLFYIYFINAVLLIDHEIDSAYWQEWNLIKALKPSGINGFLIIHVPMLFLILGGLVLVHDQSYWGLILSIALSAGGIYAFAFHSYHLIKGRAEFNTPLSRVLLTSTLVVSLAQTALSAWLMIA